MLDSYKTVPIETDQNHNITLPEIKHSLLATKQWIIKYFAQH